MNTLLPQESYITTFETTFRCVISIAWKEVSGTNTRLFIDGRLVQKRLIN